jgi:hypothetical protein
VTISNSGNLPLTIRSLYTAGWNASDWTFTAMALPVVLPPGGTLPVDLVFTPRAAGARTATFCVATDAVNAPDNLVTLTGTGFDATLVNAPGAISCSLVGATAIRMDPANVLANHAIPVTLRWGPTTAGLLASYQVQISSAGSIFNNAAVQPGTATSLTLPLAMGTAATPRDYQIRVRGVNVNGVPGPWTVGAPFRLLPYDDANAAQKYTGTFTASVLAGAYGGSVRAAAVAGAAMNLAGTPNSTITGSVAWVTTMGPDRGRASVSIDKAAATVVDLYAPTLRTAAVPYVVDLASGRTHSVTITVLGTRNVLSTTSRVDFDGLVILTSSTVTAAPTPTTLTAPVSAARRSPRRTGRCRRCWSSRPSSRIPAMVPRCCRSACRATATWS